MTDQTPKKVEKLQRDLEEYKEYLLMHGASQYARTQIRRVRKAIRAQKVARQKEGSK